MRRFIIPAVIRRATGEQPKLAPNHLDEVTPEGLAIDRITAFYVGLISVTLLSALAVFLADGSLLAVALAAFAAVVGGAIMITFGAEASQIFVSQALAAAVIALLQLSPEFAVEASIAYEGKVDLMLANFTGSNRLLMGVGWPMIYAVAAFAYRRRFGGRMRQIELRPEVVIEALVLLCPTLLFAVVLMKGHISLVDGLILAFIFVAYLYLLQRLPAEGQECEENMVPPCRRIVRMPRRTAKSFIVFLMVIGFIVIVLCAKPFVRSLEDLAVSLGVPAFFFIQWVAPFLSEFPEKIAAFYWSIRIKLAPMALMNLISSSVNQWTLLVLFIPVFYSLGQGTIMQVPLDSFLQREILLTMAMTTYGAISILKRRFTAFNAGVLFSLWLFQFLVPTELPGITEAAGGSELMLFLADTRNMATLAFGVLAAAELLRSRRDIQIRKTVRSSLELMRKGE